MAMVGEQSIEPAPERRASMRDVARAAGVSLSSVSLVAAGHPGVSEELRARTLRGMRQVGYVPRQRRAPVRTTLAIISERLTRSAASSRTARMTTVRVPRPEMGAEAVRRLLALLHGEAPRPTKTTLYTHLVVRASCGA